jgi:hypothetical protein
MLSCKAVKFTNLLQVKYLSNWTIKEGCTKLCSYCEGISNHSLTESFFSTDSHSVLQELEINGLCEEAKVGEVKWIHQGRIQQFRILIIDLCSSFLLRHWNGKYIILPSIHNKKLQYLFFVQYVSSFLQSSSEWLLCSQAQWLLCFCFIVSVELCQLFHCLPHTDLFWCSKTLIELMDDSLSAVQLPLERRSLCCLYYYTFWISLLIVTSIKFP